MKISIAMATYNGAKYIQEQLDSFLYQTLQPDELVVCDDGSTDTTLIILEAFRKQAPFVVHIYRNESNLGHMKNFEKALSLCIGDIIFLSDQDDVWFNNKLFEMVTVLDMRPDIFVLQTNMVLAGEDLTPSPYTQLGNILAIGQSPDAFIFGCATAIRKTWLDLALPIPANLAGHDNWIHRLALALGVRALHECPLQYYRRHGENASNCFASKPVRMTSIDALRESGLKDATAGWQRELARVQSTELRINERVDTLKYLGLFEKQKLARATLVRNMENLNVRIRNMTKPRILRIPNVLLLWIRGGYRQFAGWKSAAKDILRP